MAQINLDAARAARAEALKDTETPTVVFGGETFALPLELPFGVFLQLGEMREDPAAALDTIRTIVESLFGDDTPRFLALGPSFDDLLALVSALIESYDVNLPEPSAPPSQS